MRPEVLCLIWHTLRDTFISHENEFYVFCRNKRYRKHTELIMACDNGGYLMLNIVHGLDNNQRIRRFGKTPK